VLEIIGLVLASGAIAGFARGRGTSPVISVSIAIVGFLAIAFLGGLVSTNPDARIVVTLCAWAWVGAVALFVRFVVGAGRPKPDGTWACTNCLYSNGKHAVVCEACQQPWTPGR
jgi:heme A synthase